MECKLDAITVYYEVFGKGRPILMLHGMPSNHDEMVYEMERHFTNRPGWQRIYLDMPGHGKTPGPSWVTTRDQVLQILEDFIDSVIPETRFVLAATSYGAYIGRALVYRRGEGMDGLLLNVPVMGSDPAKWVKPPRTVLAENQAIMATAKSENIPWFSELSVVQNQAVLDYARALRVPEADEKKTWTFLDQIKEDFSFDVDKLPHPFPAPALFILGRQDHWVGYRNAWSIIENYPRATFAVLDRAGHLVLGEQSELCSALVKDWLDRVDEWVTQTRCV